jgi:hypothetical protein
MRWDGDFHLLYGWHAQPCVHILLSQGSLEGGRDACTNICTIVGVNPRTLFLFGHEAVNFPASYYPMRVGECIQ